MNRTRGFSLVELLTVIAIMTLMASLAVPSLRSLTGSGSFTQEVGQIAEVMEQARAYAVGQNTYVWVVFYSFDPPSETASGDSLCLAVYAANDGVDGLNWGSTTSTVIPPSSSPSVVQIFKFKIFKHLALNTGTELGNNYPGPANHESLNPFTPNSDLTFQTTLRQAGGSVTLPGNKKSYTVQFTPAGSARVSDSAVGWIQMGFQPVKARNIQDSHNLASIWISGLTGLSTVYRK